MKNTIFAKTITALVIFFVMTFVILAQQSESPVQKDRLMKVLQYTNIEKDLIVSTIQKNGVDFELTKADEAELRKLGADNNIIKAIRENYRGATNAVTQPALAQTPTVGKYTGINAKTNAGSSLKSPPVGKYQCLTSYNNDTIGWLWIMPDSQYKIVSNGTVGKFSVDSASREIVWKSGKYVDYNWRGWYLAPGDEDDVRGENSKQRHAIALLDKEKAASPFDGKRTEENNFIRCYLQEE